MFSISTGLTSHKLHLLSVFLLKFILKDLKFIGSTFNNHQILLAIFNIQNLDNKL